MNPNCIQECKLIVNVNQENQITALEQRGDTITLQVGYDDESCNWEMTSLHVEFDVILQGIWLVVLVCVSNYFSLSSPLDYLQNLKKSFFTTSGQTKLYFDSMQNSSICLHYVM